MFIYLFILFIIMMRVKGILDLGQISRYKIRVVYVDVCVDVVDFPFQWC